MTVMRWPITWPASTASRFVGILRNDELMSGEANTRRGAALVTEARGTPKSR
jgi:hypothetical protein